MAKTVYYRLKHNDINGNSTYSRILIIHLDAIIKSLIVKTENPFKGNINLLISTNNRGTVSLMIVNMSGIVLVKKY